MYNIHVCFAYMHARSVRKTYNAKQKYWKSKRIQFFSSFFSQLIQKNRNRTTSLPNSRSVKNVLAELIRHTATSFIMCFFPFGFLFVLKFLGSGVMLLNIFHFIHSLQPILSLFFKQSFIRQPYTQARMTHLKYTSHEINISK